MITGVYAAYMFPDGTCELQYTDNSRERAKVAGDVNTYDDFFKLVGIVQGQRKQSNETA